MAQRSTGRLRRRAATLWTLGWVLVVVAAGPAFAVASGAGPASITDESTEPAASATNETAPASAAAMHAPAAWADGYTGANVTVAVIDGAFDADHPPIASNVADTVAVGGPGDFNSSGFDGPGVPDEKHGTRVAETVTQVAPDVDLLLYDVANTGNAEAEAIRRASERADVITIAHGPWYNAPLDGTGPVNRAIDDARATGTSVVVAAGNLGDNRTYRSNWTDTDGDGVHEFAPGEETMRVERMHRAQLQWTDWDDLDSEYDLTVTFAANDTVAPFDHRDGDGIPLDTVESSPAPDVPLNLRIESSDPDPDDRLSLLVHTDYRDRDVEYASQTGSLVSYATARGAITVGAFDTGTTAMAPYSSAGPTVDGRQKPEVVGPTNVTLSSGIEFGGTSAAAPAVAGTVALLVEADPTLDPAAIDRLLTETAAPIDGASVRTGAGLVNASAATDQATAVDLIDGARPTDPDGDGLYEDLSGNGKIDFPDVNTLFQHADDSVVSDHAEAYDFTGDGSVDLQDVLALFDRV